MREYELKKYLEEHGETLCRITYTERPNTPIGTEIYFVAQGEQSPTSYNSKLNNSNPSQFQNDSNWWYEWHTEVEIVGKAETIESKSFKIISNEKTISIIDNDNDCIEINKSDLKELSKLIDKIK